MKEDVVKAMQRRQNEVLTTAEKLMENIKDWQAIKKYMSNRVGEFELTPEQQKKLARYQFIYNQLVSGNYLESEVINQLMNPEFYGLSQSQAYEDMNCAKELISSVVNINKRFDLHLMIQLNKLYQQKAKEMGDYKALASFEKNGIALMAQVPDEQETPGDLFEGIMIDAVFDPSLLGAPKVNMREVLQLLNEKRDVKINLDMFEELEVVPTQPPA